MVAKMLLVAWCVVVGLAIYTVDVRVMARIHAQDRWLNPNAQGDDSACTLARTC